MATLDEKAGVRHVLVDGETMVETGAETGADRELAQLKPALKACGNVGEAWLLDPRIVAAVAGSGLFDESGVPALATGA